MAKDNRKFVEMTKGYRAAELDPNQLLEKLLEAVDLQDIPEVIISGRAGRAARAVGNTRQQLQESRKAYIEERLIHESIPKNNPVASVTQGRVKDAQSGMEDAYQKFYRIATAAGIVYSQEDATQAIPDGESESYAQKHVEHDLTAINRCIEMRTKAYTKGSGRV